MINPKIPTNASLFEQLDLDVSLRKQEIFCPISKIKVLVSGLKLKDDKMLKTMAASPATYDLDITKMLYSHCTFPDLKKRPSFEEFETSFSHHDKRLLIFGLYTATYNDFGSEKIECPNCEHSFTDIIKPDHLIHDKFINLWDKEENFTVFEHEIRIENENKTSVVDSFVFKTIVPTIKQYNKILKFISTDTLTTNLNESGSIFTKTDNIALITKEIVVTTKTKDENGEFKDDDKNVNIIVSLNDIFKFINNYLSPDNSDVILDNYSKNMLKYRPEFKKPITCSNCGNEFDYELDVDLILFRKYFRF